MKLEDLVHHGLETKLEIPVYSNERMIGKCMYLKENKQMNTYSAFTFIKGITFPGVTGTSKAFQHTLEEIKLVSPTDASVYVCGETGVERNMSRERFMKIVQEKTGPL